LQESAVWIDESTTCGAVFGRIRAASPIVSQDLDDPLGISDEASELVASLLSHLPKHLSNILQSVGLGDSATCDMNT